MHVTNYIAFKWFVCDLEVCLIGKNNPMRLMTHFCQISIYFFKHALNRSLGKFDLLSDYFTTPCAVDFILRRIY